MGSTDKQIFDKTTWKRPLNKTLTLFIMYGCVAQWFYTVTNDVNIAKYVLNNR